MLRPRSFVAQFIYLLRSLSHLLYPDLCLHCKRSLQQNSPFLCYACLSRIELVKWCEKEVHHLLEQSLNKTGLLSSSVLYRFEQGNPVQTILHVSRQACVRLRAPPVFGVCLAIFVMLGCFECRLVSVHVLHPPDKPCSSAGRIQTML